MVRRLLYIVCCLPAVLLALHLATDSVNLYRGPEWHLMQTALDAVKGGLGQVDLMARMGDSRPVLARLAYIGAARFFHGSLHLLVALGLMLAVVTVLGLWPVIRRTIRGPRARLAAFICASLLVFSPAAYANWLWGLGFARLLPPALLVVCLAVNQTRAPFWLKVALAALAASLASLTHVTGLLLWPLAFPWGDLARRRHENTKGARLVPGLVYFLAMGAACWAYFRGFQLPAPPAETGEAAQTTGLFGFLPVWLGAPLTGDGGGEQARSLTLAVAAYLGWIFVGLYAVFVFVAVRRRRHARVLGLMLPWLTLGAFGLAAGVCCWLLGSDATPVQALDPLGLPLSLTLALALAGLVAVEVGLAERDRARTLAMVALALTAFALPAFYHSYADGLAGMNRLRAERDRELLALRFMDVLPDNPELAKIGPGDLAVAPLTRKLADAGLLPLIPVPPEFLPANPQSPLRGDFDAAEGFGQGDVKVSGWVATTDGSTPSVALSIPDATGRPRVFALLPVDQQRPDVVKALGLPSSARPGFASIVTPPADAPDNVLIQAWAWTPTDNVLRKLPGEHLADLRNLALLRHEPGLPNQQPQTIKGSLDQATFDDAGHLYVAGWGADVHDMTPAAGVLILLSAKGLASYYVRLPVGLPRPDVARALQNENLTSSGFAAVISLEDLPQDVPLSTWTISAWVTARNGVVLARIQQPEPAPADPKAKSS